MPRGRPPRDAHQHLETDELRFRIKELLIQKSRVELQIDRLKATLRSRRKGDVPSSPDSIG